MQQLNLPKFNFRIKETGNQKEIFDPVRRKFVALTPEEWVRQNFIQFLVEHKKVPASLIAVEKALTLNKLTKRTDVVIYGRQTKPVMIVECKAPGVKISQAVFEQIGRYNMALQVDFLVVTNGLSHYCARINFANGSFEFLEEIPNYENLG
jgi:type I site-specific restriction endonuclease